MAALSAPHLTGSKKEPLDPAVFGEEFHESLVHDAVRAELNARRRGTASTKTRGEVAMTGAKAFRQKGTGRARAGALSTPNRYGGGVAFGPRPRSYTFKINKRARRRALRAALTVHAERGSIAIVDPTRFDAPSTKKAVAMEPKLAGERVLVVLAREGEENVAKSFRNVARVVILPADDVGVADVLRARWLVLSPGALEHLTTLAAGASKDKEA